MNKYLIALAFTIPAFAFSATTQEVENMLMKFEDRCMVGKVHFRSGAGKLVAGIQTNECGGYTVSFYDITPIGSALEYIENNKIPYRTLSEEALIKQRKWYYDQGVTSIVELEFQSNTASMDSRISARDNAITSLRYIVETGSEATIDDLEMVFD